LRYNREGKGDGRGPRPPAPVAVTGIRGGNNRGAADIRGITMTGPRPQPPRALFRIRRSVRTQRDTSLGGPRCIPEKKPGSFCPWGKRIQGDVRITAPGATNRCCWYPGPGAQKKQGGSPRKRLKTSGLGKGKTREQRGVWRRHGGLFRNYDRTDCGQRVSFPRSHGKTKNGWERGYPPPRDSTWQHDPCHPFRLGAGGGWVEGTQALRQKKKKKRQRSRTHPLAMHGYDAPLHRAKYWGRPGKGGGAPAPTN